jgi:hypothetical protein
MAGKSTDPAEAAPVEVPAVRFLVVYPRVGVMVDGDQVVIEKGSYLDEKLPAELAAEKGRELMTYGMVAAHSGAAPQ